MKTREHQIREKTATSADCFHLRRGRCAESIRDQIAPALSVGAKFYPAAPVEQEQRAQEKKRT